MEFQLPPLRPGPRRTAFRLTLAQRGLTLPCWCPSRKGKGILKSLELIKPIIIENRFRIVIGLISLIIVDVLQLIIPRIIKTAVDSLTLYEASWNSLLRQALLI